jgi:Domain of unknown function (DUF4440)
VTVVVTGLMALVFAGCAGSRNLAMNQSMPSQSAAEAELRHDTQDLLDAIAPGNRAVWDRLLDSAAIQIDENDVVRDKSQILAGLEPLGPGLVGHLTIDEFRVVLHGNVAVATHEDREYLDYHGQVIRSRFRTTDTWLREGTDWRQVASQVLAVQQDPPSIRLDNATLCTYSGRYAMTTTIVATLRCSGDSLIMERPGRANRTFLPETRDVFFAPGEPRTRRIFQYDAEGHITGFVDRREARDIAWKRIGPAD